MRTDLNMRKGKMCAQSAHAAMEFMISEPVGSWSAEIRTWFRHGTPKIVVGCPSLEDLQELYEKALYAKLVVHKVKDLGYTEFHGVPTVTCIAIGPNLATQIDPLTKHLKLL